MNVTLNRPDDILDMTIRIMDKLSEMKVLNKKQSADEDFAIQDAITKEIEIVFYRKIGESKWAELE